MKNDRFWVISDVEIDVNQKQDYLIAGCGYIGQALAKALVSEGHQVVGLTHSEESAQKLAAEVSFEVRAGDLSSESSLRSLAQGLSFAPTAIVHCASSGRRGIEAYEQVYFGGCTNLLAAFPDSKLLFTSSTSVYSQVDGSVVTENCPAEPDRETGKVLRRAEDVVLGARGIVTRLAGLYGPSRSVLLKRFLTGTAAIETGTSRWMNQIHRDDVASAIQLLLERSDEASGQIFNVSDGNPTTQRACYEGLAAHFDEAIPPESPPDHNRKRGWTHKQISNAKLREWGWNPRFPRFLDAIENDSALIPSIRAQIIPKRV